MHQAIGGRNAAFVARVGAGQRANSALRLPVQCSAKKQQSVGNGKKDVQETRLMSTLVPAVAALTLASLPSGLESGLPLDAVLSLASLQSALQPAADSLNQLGLPSALIRWGHPGNMGVVLAAMGMYGSGYLGWAIRTSEDDDLIEKAKDLHPKLAIGMTVFFALGATGGLLSLVMQGKDVFQSPHVWTGIGGLVLLGLQGMLSLFFQDDPNARSAHAYLGTSILALFVVHAALGLQLGLSLGA